MDRKREDHPRKPFEEGKQGHKPRQAGESAKGESEEATPSEKEVLVTIVDETIEAQDLAEAVTDPVEPRMAVHEFSHDELQVQSVSNLKALRTNQTVKARVRPQQHLKDQTTQDAASVEPVSRVPICDSIEAERTTTSSIEEVRPAEQLDPGRDVEVALKGETAADRINEQVTHMVEPQQTTAQLTGGNEFFDIDESDPMFRWSGGSPFGSDRPKFVVHINTGNVPSLQFLQVLLRDTYKEIHGGEPGAETVEFVANEPRIPTVQKNIVTLDLTTDNWDPSVRNGSPVIEGKGGDIVPELQQIAAELYTGDQGYFVLNVPADFEHRYRRKGFHRKLVETLAGQEVSESQNEPSSLVEKVRASPVVLVEPQTDEETVFFEKVSRYFSLTPLRDGTSVSQVEEVQERVLKKNDWRRIALTERQEDNGESSEHYFWKAAIATGLARAMWAENEQGFTQFDPFLKQEVLSRTVIETEPENPDGVEGYPDIYIDESQEWAIDGLNAFIDTDADYAVSPPVAIEFETGRSEGAFNFRKIRDTLEKYSAGTVGTYLVIPNRILFQGRKRADMIISLVEAWRQANPVEAGIFTPILDGGRCTGLQPAKTVVNELYGDKDDG